MKELESFTPRTEKTKTKNELVYENAKKLQSICFNDYNNTTNEAKKKMREKYNPNNLLIESFKFIYPNKKGEEKSKSRPEKIITE